MDEEDNPFFDMNRLLLLLIIVLFGCTKGELPTPNGSDFQPIIGYNTPDQSIPEEEKYFDLTVNAVRSPPLNTGLQSTNIYQYYTDIDFNNHPGYDLNIWGGWVNLEHNSSSNITKWGFGRFSLLLLSESDVTISSTPAKSYYFYVWSNGSKENPLTVKLSSVINISAIFKIED